MLRRLPTRPLLALLLGASAVSLVAGVRNAVGSSLDLQPYLEGARMWLRGVSPYDVDLPTGFVYLPQAALLFAPLAALPDPVARGVWAALNTLLWLGSLALLARIFARGDRRLAWWMLAAAAGWACARVTLGNGQLGIFTVAALVAALAAGQRGRHLLAGVALGLALTKWSLSLPFVVYFAARGRWSTLALAALTVAGGYLAFGLRLGQGPWAVAVDYAYVLKAHAGVKHAFFRTSELTAAGTAVASLWGELAVAAVGGGALLAAGWACRRRSGPREAALLLAICAVCSLTMLPHLHYDQVVLALAVLPLMAWPAEPLRPWARGMALITCALLWLDLPGSLWKFAGRPDPIAEGGIVWLAYVGFDRLWLGLLFAALMVALGPGWRDR
ncbi:MAG: hypothetical protein CMJ87_13470 [Planctomycetes bacterium]|jgi:hypothetical protein|nr:hypothetical protein [Planctomycetota bacterium]